MFSIDPSASSGVWPVADGMSGADAGPCLSQRNRNQYHQGDVWPLRGKQIQKHSKKHIFSVYFWMFKMLKNNSSRMSAKAPKRSSRQTRNARFLSSIPNKVHFARKRITRSCNWKWGLEKLKIFWLRLFRNKTISFPEEIRSTDFQEITLFLFNLIFEK